MFHIALPARLASVGRARHALEDWLDAQPEQLTRARRPTCSWPCPRRAPTPSLHAYDLEEGELRAEASFDARGLVVGSPTTAAGGPPAMASTAGA